MVAAEGAEVVVVADPKPNEGATEAAAVDAGTVVGPAAVEITLAASEVEVGAPKERPK